MVSPHSSPSIPFPQHGTGLFPPRVISVKRLSLLLEQSLHGESDESTMSSQARNLSTETSIQASQGSLALIVWPTSWNLLDKGWKSRMRWMALSCLSLLTNTSDLSTLLRSWTLTRLKLGATCLLFAKIAEKQKQGQNNKALHQKKMKC